MSAIHRLSVTVTDYQVIGIGGPVLSVAPDRGGRSDVFDLWYEENNAQLVRGLYVFGTGHPTPWDHYTRHAWQFIGTVVTPSDLVWHIYVGPKDGEAIPV